MLAEPVIDTSLKPLEAFQAVRRLIANPGDTREVFTIFRAMRGRSGLKAFRRFAASPTGAQVLHERRSLLRALQDRAALAALPPGTLGRDYLAFMEEQNLSAEGLVQASDSWEQDVVPPAMHFYRERMRDAHDLTHILTGYGRDPLGEVCLLAFSYAHTRNLGMAMIVGMAMLKMPRTARKAVRQAWRHGRKAQWFPALDYEALLSRPLTEIRAELNIAPPLLYQAIAA
jgi:ubiquinone biosynthesis protein COQ4